MQSSNYKMTKEQLQNFIVAFVMNALEQGQNSKRDLKKKLQVRLREEYNANAKKLLNEVLQSLIQNKVIYQTKQWYHR